MDFGCISPKHEDLYAANLTKTVVFWISGLVVGMFFYKLNDPMPQSFFRRFWSSNYSFFSILLIGLFPVVISTVSLCTLPLGFFWLNVFAFALFHSYIGCSLVNISQKHSLLFWTSLQFPRVISIPVLWYLWLIFLKKNQPRAVCWQFLFLVVLDILCYSVQSAIVLPFFQSTIIF